MISINKYGQNIDLSKIVAVNGTKSISLDGLTLNETLIINVTKGMKFKSSLEENDLKIEFTDIDGSIFEVILKDMATLLAENDGEKLVDIVQTDDNKVLSSITDINSALAAAAAGAEAPGAGNNATNSDSAANNDGFANGLNITPTSYANATLPDSVNALAAAAVDETRRNFAPTIETISAQNVDEDNSLLITYIAADANDDALTTTVTATNGTAVITEAGQILFTPNANFNGAAEIVLTITDGLLTTVQTIAVTVNPVNDAPVLDTITAVTVSEDDSVFSGTITSSDVDANATAVYTTTSTVAGFTLNANGTYTFDAADAAYQSLAAGISQIITIPVTVTDDANASATQNLTITITGTNDAPTVSVTPVSLSETDFTVLNGYENSYKIITETEMYAILGADDVDVNDSLTLSLVTDSSDFTSTTNAGIVNSNSGVVQLTAADIVGFGLTGVANVGDFFIYSIGFDGLNATDVANVTFDVILSDGTDSVTSTVSLTVDGVNDAPTVSVTPVSLSETDFTVLNGYENSYKIITETEMYAILGADDVDVNDSLTLSLVTDSSDFTSTTNAGIVNSNSGVVQLTAADIVGFGLTGVANVGDFFIYSIGFDGLNATDVANVTFDVILSDGTDSVTSTVSLTVDGVNDAPTVSVTPVSLSETDFTVLNGYENSYKIITETEMYAILGADDVDVNDSLTLSLVTDSSDFTSTTNAGIVNSNSGVVQLTAADIVGFGLTGVANVGDFFIYSIGFDGLNATDVANVTFDVILSDGTDSVTSTVSLTVDGVNDAPTVSVTPVSLSETDFTVLNGYENSYKIITETEMYAILGADDVDVNDSLTLSLVTDSSDFTSTTNAGIVNSNSGVVQLTAADIVGFGLTGVANVGDFFIYSIGFDGLNATDVANVTFDVILSDGTDSVTSTVSLTVDGVNDAPTVSVTPVSLSETDFTVLNGYENSYKIITETEMYAILGADDVDVNDSLTLSLVTDSSDFTSTTNAGIVNSNSGVVQLTAADIVGFGLTGVANVGDFFIYSIGFDGLNATDVANVTFDVILSDGTAPVTSTVTLTVNGVNDAPTVVAAPATTLSETDFATLSGYENAYKIITETEMYAILGANDVDVNDSLTLSLVTDSSNFTSSNAGIDNTTSGVVQLTAADITALGITANVGDFFIYSLGFDGLNASETSTATFNVILSDGTAPVTSTVTLTVNGVNDAPTVVVAPATTLSETDFATLSGYENAYKIITETEMYAILGANDVDVNDSLTLSLVTDSSNFTSSNAGIDNTTSGVVQLTAADITALGITANVGDFFIYSLGFDGLNASETSTATFNVILSDGTAPVTSTVTLTVNGVNDAPTVVAAPATTLSETDFATLSGYENAYKIITETEMYAILGANDVDVNDSLTLSLVTDSSNFTSSNAGIDNTTSGVVQLTAADITALGITANVGDFFIYSLGFDGLNASETSTATFNVILSDGTAPVTSTVTLTVNGVNDAPTVVAAPATTLSETDFATLSGYENAYKIITETEMYAILGANDVDVNDSLTLSLVTDSSNFTSSNAGIDNTTSGVVQLTAADITALGITANVGDFFIYSLGFDGLNASETSTATFNVILSDGTAPVTSTVTLTVNGVNDAPTVVAAPATTLSETDFATLSGYENAYKIITETEMYAILGANDVDVNDSLTLSLVTDSSNFTSSNAGIDNTTSGVVQLTAADITALGITANVGDFFIYSLGFDGLNASETSTATFNVILSDGTAPVTSTVTLTVNGVNDAPVASATSTIVANDVSYVGQLVASDTDLNDALTYTYDNTSVSMTLTVAGLNNLDTLMAFNNASTLSALTELKAAASSFVSTGSLAGLLTITPSTIAIGKTAVSTLLNFLNTNSGLDDIKDFIVDNRDVIIANTELSSDDITLIQGLLTTTNISALNTLFTVYGPFITNPTVQGILSDNSISQDELSELSSNPIVQAFVANVQSLLAANTAILSLIDIPTIIAKLQSIIAVDTANGEVSVTAEIPSTTADVMIDLNATTGTYEITNPYLATLPDNTQVEVKFDYTVTDSAGASDDSTAAIMITSENVDKVSASLDDDGTLVMGDEKDIDMASLLSNITSNINVADIDSIDLSSNEHILSNLTIADFQEMVSDSSSNTLEIKGENNDIIKLDPAIWLKDTTDTDSNSVVDNTDDHFVPYKATGTDSQVLTLLIDKDIIVQDI